MRHFAALVLALLAATAHGQADDPEQTIIAHCRTAQTLIAKQHETTGRDRSNVYAGASEAACAKRGIELTLAASQAFVAQDPPLAPLYMSCRKTGREDVSQVCQYVEISRAMSEVFAAYERYHRAHDAMIEAEAEVNRVAEIAREEGYVFGHDEAKCGKNSTPFMSKWSGTLHECFSIVEFPPKP
jgi:hypothetical protein